jgi:hypothetical protein
LELKHVAKKAAKKSAKKAAKKAPAKHAAKHAAKQAGQPGRDTRRAYEHLGRVQSLAAQMGSTGSEGAKTLAGYAEQALRAGASKDAAELLRAAEHHLFGTLAMAQAADESLSPELLGSIRDEYEHLVERAGEHGGCEAAPRPIATLYKAMQKAAAAASRAGQFRAALEFARGAEALTHADFARLLASGDIKQLRQVSVR